MQEGSDNKLILKEEIVFYLKSKINLQAGVLFITPSRIILRSHKTKEENFGFLNFLFKQHREGDRTIFDIEYKDIRSVSERRLSLQKNIMIIIDKNQNMYYVLVKNYKEWEDYLIQKLMPSA